MSNHKRIKKSIAVLAVVTLLTTGVTSYAAMAKETELTVVTDSVVHEVSTQAATVGALLEEIGYKTSDRTILNIPEDTVITEDLQIVVTTKDTVELHLRGIESEVNTQAATVGEFLQEQGIELKEHDVLYPAADTPIHDRIAVTIDSVVVTETVEETEIAHETEYQWTDEMYEGESRVAQSGENGVLHTITTTRSYNGVQLPSSTKEVVAKEPVTHIVEEGSLVYVEPVTEAAYTESYTEAATESSYSNSGGWMSFTATAYDPTVGDTTRMGTPARVGVVAVDPSVIPLGATVEIEGYGVYSAEDTGSAIIGNRIDIFLSSHSEAINFGVRSVRVRILY